VLEIRRDADIHREQGEWFEARWHFSFDRYRDPAQMGIGPLRVFNDDRLVPGADWPMHPHADVEGLTYVVEGTFEHADSLGNAGRLQPGGVQRMTLGSGALHSERNGSATEPMRFLQFWILPDTPELDPSVEQRQFTREDRRNRFLPVIGPKGGRVVSVHQDAEVYVGAFELDARADFKVDDGRGGYLYVIGGAISMNGEMLKTGDAAAIEGEPEIAIEANEPSELLLVDVSAQGEV